MKTTTIGHRDVAINGVRDYLIALLLAEQWCAARSVGNALGYIIDSFPKEVMLHKGNYTDEAKRPEASQEIPRVNRFTGDGAKTTLDGARG